MARKYPEIIPEVRELETPKLFAALRHAEIDAAVGPEAEWMMAKAFSRADFTMQRLMVALARAEPLARKRAIPLVELKNQRFVVFQEKIAPGLVRWITEVCAEAGFAPKVDSQMATTDELLARVAAGGVIARLLEGYRWRLPHDVVIPRQMI